MHLTTRKLSYRKDDRAMCPIHGCPEKFPESLTTPTATFPEICKGILFRSIEVRSFARFWDNRGTKKFEQSLDMPTLLFFPKFLSAFVRM